MTAYQWNAQDYAQSSSEQQKWARELIAKLHLQGNERLLDIGCGDGKVSAELASHLPEGSVLGIDNSPSMIALAQQQFPPETIPNLRFRLADASALPFEQEFEVVFSNATLHWVLDHKPVLKGIRRSLRPDGKALLQMGGRGNASEVIQAFDRVRDEQGWKEFFEGFTFPYGFYGPEEYASWLEEAGLKADRVELISKDMVHKDRRAFEAWIRTTWLPYSQRVPEELRPAFIGQAADIYLRSYPPDQAGAVHVAMVRLEVEARRMESLHG